MAKSDAHNLWERMQKHEIAVLRFAKHPDVTFTNNRARMGHARIRGSRGWVTEMDPGNWTVR